ncbi:S8 family serine peptidase [Pseudomonas putida]|uniref:Thermitase n=2 Tax=Pseudomonas putida group TaxID=136845 RepID=V9UWX4_9PSED|nr:MULTISPECIES: S8 family serine peptidase [Pseudomonas]AHC82326.1 thermitase [Pseudomonas monteilii SB3078]AHC87704.1 thermitase [Pseudomonas monteilii SB3101]QKK96839.1 S8 family serine peptidase [Pseudomonas sp. 13159349]
MDYLAILRKLVNQAQTVAATTDGFPPDELRFVLEYKKPPDIAIERGRIAALLGSTNLSLQPLDTLLKSFLVLHCLGVERTLPSRELFSMGYALTNALDLLSAEPDLGTGFYTEPVEPGEEAATEALEWLEATCIVKKAPPPDRRWALKSAGVVDAWALSRGAGIIIAQADTGITEHAQLGDEMLDKTRAYDFIDNDPNPTDPLSPKMGNPGHGTATASVLAGRDTAQMCGAAPSAKIAPIRCIENVKIFNAAPVAKAIAHATQVGCHVISMSLGGVPSRVLHAAVREAVSANLIVIAAAGNCARIVVWPARYDEVIAVGGSNVEDGTWIGSCRGEAVDITAPAELVWRAQRHTSSEPTDVVAPGQGTSFATAITAGAAALWLAHHGRDKVIDYATQQGVTVQQLFKAALLATSRQPAVWDAENYGRGLVAADELLKLALSDIPVVNVESLGGPERDVQTLLNQEYGCAVIDPALRLAKYETEIATIALAQARATGVASGLNTESKWFSTRPSTELNEYIQQSTDPRLRRFAEVPGKTSLARLPSTGPLSFQDRRISLALPTKALGLESAQGFSSERARDYLRGAGKHEQLDRFTRLLDARSGITRETREKLVETVEQDLDGYVKGRNAGSTTTVGLEALVRMTGRPTLRVRNNDVDSDHPEAAAWSDTLYLMRNDQSLQDRLCRIGRIDVGGIHVGTGFLIGDGVLLTNRHVLQAFAAPIPQRNNPKDWIMFSNDVTIDFADEPSSLTTATRFRITEVIGAGAQQIPDNMADFSCLDAALLQVESSNAQRSLPTPMTLVKDPSKADVNSQVFLAGYPGRPGELPRTATGAIDAQIATRLNELFGADYGTKYLSPGLIMRGVGTLPRDTERSVLTHDATTLGGCSGSPLINFNSPQGVVGLHFGGSWLRENYAHGIGAVAASENPISRAKLNWV